MLLLCERVTWGTRCGIHSEIRCPVASCTKSAPSMSKARDRPFFTSFRCESNSDSRPLLTNTALTLSFSKYYTEFHRVLVKVRFCFLYISIYLKKKKRYKTLGFLVARVEHSLFIFHEKFKHFRILHDGKYSHNAPANPPDTFYQKYTFCYREE